MFPQWKIWFGTLTTSSAFLSEQERSGRRGCLLSNHRFVLLVDASCCQLTSFIGLLLCLYLDRQSSEERLLEPSLSPPSHAGCVSWQGLSFPVMTCVWRNAIGGRDARRRFKNIEKYIGIAFAGQKLKIDLLARKLEDQLAGQCTSWSPRMIMFLNRTLSQ